MTHVSAAIAQEAVQSCKNGLWCKLQQEQLATKQVKMDEKID
jgi:hypothetical protein